MVREAFAAHDAPRRPLAASVHSLGPHRVAVAADLTEPHNRLVVDEYALQQDGQYHVRSIGVDMHR